jgi:hypothetical protein
MESPQLIWSGSFAGFGVFRIEERKGKAGEVAGGIVPRAEGLKQLCLGPEMRWGEPVSSSGVGRCSVA